MLTESFVPAWPRDRHAGARPPASQRQAGGSWMGGREGVKPTGRVTVALCVAAVGGSSLRTPCAASPLPQNRPSPSLSLLCFPRPHCFLCPPCWEAPCCSCRGVSPSAARGCLLRLRAACPCLWPPVGPWPLSPTHRTPPLHGQEVPGPLASLLCIPALGRIWCVVAAH